MIPNGGGGCCRYCLFSIDFNRRGFIINFLQLRLKEERQGMRCLLLLFGRLILFLQFFDKQTHMFRFGIRKRVFTAEVEIIPQPLPVILAAGNRHRPFFQNGLELRQNIAWYRLH